MVIAWYRDNGYDFIALSDHNVLAAGERWVNVAAPEQRAAFERYRARFDSSWVEFVAVGDTLSVRLKTLEEYRVLFEEGARFLILQSEEITDRFETTPVHVNATNLVSLIAPQGGTSVLDVLQNNVDAVLAQRRETGQPMFPHVNHPNFGWAITAEDLIALQGERFFEVYNGHPLVHNEGDAEHPGMGAPDPGCASAVRDRRRRRAPLPHRGTTAKQSWARLDHGARGNAHARRTRRRNGGG
jgi:hypothetical protein